MIILIALVAMLCFLTVYNFRAIDKVLGILTDIRTLLENKDTDK